MKEMWKQVKDNKYYLISNKGRVKSLVSKMLLSPQFTKKGYLRVGLYYYTGEDVHAEDLDARGRKRITLRRFGRVGKHRGRLVHQLVLLAFGEKPSGATMINHKDGNKTNNSIENLEWCDNSKNMKHAYRTGLIGSREGENAGNVKLKESDVLLIRERIKQGISDLEIGKEFGVTGANVYRIRKGLTWKLVK